MMDKKKLGEIIYVTVLWTETYISFPVYRRHTISGDIPTFGA